MKIYKIFTFKLLLLILIVFSSCSRYNIKLYSILSKLPKDTILTIKTYDGSGQTVHPDIVYVEQNNSKGEFVLAITPYPYYNDSLENPCIYKSNDGLNFYEPAKGLNPLVKTPIAISKNKKHHNDDPDISYDIENKIFDLIYLETMPPDSQKLNLLTSKDAISWNKKNIIKYDLIKNDRFILSPAIVSKGKELFMYYINKKDKTKNTIEFLKSKKIDKWDKQEVFLPIISLPEDITPWHIDIIKGNKRFYMLLNGYIGKEPEWNDKTPNKYALYISESKDLLNWGKPIKLMDCKDIPESDCNYIYRSTGLIDDNLIVIWYSFTTLKNEWKLGVKKFINFKSL